MSTPALLAVIAASASRAEQRHLDAFRQADATAPARAQPLATLGLRRDTAFERLQTVGILREAGGGRFYLDEAALIARRRARPPRAVLVALVVLLVIGLVAAVGLAGLARLLRLP